jgi:hypothetical protein
MLGHEDDTPRKRKNDEPRATRTTPILLLMTLLALLVLVFALKGLPDGIHREIPTLQMVTASITERPSAVAMTTTFIPQGERPLSREGWHATASDSDVAHDWTPDKAITDRAITDDPKLRWASNWSQRGGEWFQIDLGAVQTFNAITLDTGPIFTSDYPRGFEVWVSNNNVDWGDAPIANGNGDGPITKIAFSVQHVRYIRIFQTGTTGVHGWWWSIASINLYRPS